MQCEKSGKHWPRIYEGERAGGGQQRDGIDCRFHRFGPPNPPSINVLYVSITYTDNSVFRKYIPTVSSRSLAPGEMFQIAKKDEVQCLLVRSAI